MCQGGCRVLFLQVYRVRSLVSWFDLCALACFLRSSPGPFRAGVPDRMALVGSGRTSRRRAVSRVSVNPGRRRGVEAESSTLGQVFRSERPSGGGWSPKRALRSERWAKVVDERALFLFGQTFRSMTRPPFWPVVLYSWASPRVACCLFGPSLGVEAGPRGTPGL